jgi:hypothetical protein
MPCHARCKTVVLGKVAQQRISVASVAFPKKRAIYGGRETNAFARTTSVTALALPAVAGNYCEAFARVTWILDGGEHDLPISLEGFVVRIPGT